eukprot:GEMP01006654.1.p1 GENE.GEMP01006654.1~~GEMP01006654.1.p1  ORF type:complete len:730 (+),score=142.04 GEMP01006654.1:34-2223(+)
MVVALADDLDSIVENIRPLEHGRDPTVLRISKPDALQQQRDYENALAHGRADTLHAWMEYIKWLIQVPHFTKEDVKNVICRALKKFLSQPILYEDKQYLLMWLLYSAYLKDRMQVYQYLWGKQIGVSLSRFYIQWARNLEHERWYSYADEVYRLGIHRDAQPFERLQSAHLGFEQRMVERVRKFMPEQADAPCRHALNPLTAREAQSLYRSLSDRRGRRHHRGQPLQPNGFTGADATNQRREQIHVYEDPSVVHQSLFDSDISQWCAEFPSDDSCFQKQNRHVVKMTACRSVPCSRPIYPPSAPLQVYCDNACLPLVEDDENDLDDLLAEFTKEPNIVSPVAKKVPFGVVAPNPREEATVETLRKVPFKSVPTGGSKNTWKSNFALSVGDDETSAEEVRAQRWFENRNKQSAPLADARAAEKPVDSSACQSAVNSTFSASLNETTFFLRETMKELQTCFKDKDPVYAPVNELQVKTHILPTPQQSASSKVVAYEDNNASPSKLVVCDGSADIPASSSSRACHPSEKRQREPAALSSSKHASEKRLRDGAKRVPLLERQKSPKRFKSVGLNGQRRVEADVLNLSKRVKSASGRSPQRIPLPQCCALPQRVPQRSSRQPPKRLKSHGRSPRNGKPPHETSNRYERNPDIHIQAPAESAAYCSLPSRDVDMKDVPQSDRALFVGDKRARDIVNTQGARSSPPTKMSVLPPEYSISSIFSPPCTAELLFDSPF